jgi:hypothetical protein
MVICKPRSTEILRDSSFVANVKLYNQLVGSYTFQCGIFIRTSALTPLFTYVMLRQYYIPIQSQFWLQPYNFHQ